MVVDQGEIELIDFEDPVAAPNVNDVYSCIIYWVDEVDYIGPPATANRTIYVGDGTVWDWWTIGPSAPSDAESQYSVDISSYFDGIANDEEAIGNIKLKYVSNDSSGLVDILLDQVYITVNYTY